MRQTGLPCVLTVLLVVQCGAFAWAATTPLTGSASEPPGLVEGARPSLFMEIGRAVLKLQRELNREIGRHMRAIRDGDSPRTLVAGLAFAFLYGVLHTLGPGHCKFVVLSYFISREARIWRGLLMGLQISVTHVISALVLLWLADVSLKTVLGGSPAAMRGVQLVSYGATAAIGVVMLVRAVQRSLPGHDAGTQRGESHHGHGGKQLGLVSFSVGLVPCTGAILIMLFALANDMVFTGTVMVAAIAVGMAVTMSVLGILGILARWVVLSRVEAAGQGPSAVALALEYAGALVILTVSSVLFVGSL
jgi:nickel/cobalt exporter